MKGKGKKNVTNPNDQQQSRRDAHTDAPGRPDEQNTFDKAGKDSRNTDPAKKQAPSSRSGRKSRDNFGSYKGY